MELYDSVDVIKNVGGERKKKFNKLGIFTVLDLLEHFPRDYNDRSDLKKTDEIVINEENTVKGVISTKPDIFTKGKFQIVKAKIHDDRGTLYAVWFNQPYLKNTLKIGETYVFTGKAVLKYNSVTLESPDFEIYGEKELLSTGRIVPVYSATAGLSQKIIRSVIKSVIDNISGKIDEFIPDNIRKKYKLCERKFAVFNIHFPENDESFFIARKRLVFEELFLLQAKLLQVKGFIKKRERAVVIEDFDISGLTEVLPFSFTNAQKRVLSEIISDFKNGTTMSRLVQGDVGSGKTAVAMTAAYIMAKNGYQTALMAPTDVLANQHFESFSKVFEKLGIKCALLSGGLKKSEKRRVYESIELGYAKIVIGNSGRR